MEEIKLPFGVRNGKIIHISELNEADRGLKCNCICAHCGGKLVAKLGDINIKHFSHYSKNCSKSLESSLHLFAKEVLQKNKKIKIPSLKIFYHANSFEDNDFKCTYNNDYGHYYYNKCEIIAPETVIEFDIVELETRLDNIVPDVVLYKNNKPLLIEIAVTHLINKEKFEKIKEKNLSTIEIYLDLNEIDKYNFDKEYVENLIINGVKNKAWIYNSKIDDKIKNLIEQFKKEEEAEKRLAQTKKERKENSKLEAKTYVCMSCEESTNDWITAYGDGTCLCRNCRIEYLKKQT